MIEHSSTFSNSGIFSISPNHKLYGTLSMNGPSSLLRVWSDSELGLDSHHVQTITGVLDNQMKVTLIDCLRSKSGRRYGDGDFSHYVEFFPHYGIVGSRCFSSSDEFILNISLVLDDAPTLFCDRRSFGSVIVKSDDLEKLRSLDSFEKVPFEYEEPILGYFTGNREIFSAETVIGTISAWNSPSFNAGSPTGVYINNTISVEMDFAHPVDVRDMETRIGKLLRFLEVIVGRPQNLVEVKVSLDQDRRESSTVYINLYPTTERGSDSGESDSHDILIDAVSEPDKFANLMCAWLRCDDTWKAARYRFSDGWRKQNSFDPDRMVGAANMFDLLPSDAVPKEVPLPIDLSTAIEESRELFRGLQKSSKRDAVLGFLGRIKRQSLKDKIRYRSTFITNVIGEWIQDLDRVTDAAVELRNFYVHGDTPDRKRARLERSLGFLTRTLEFVFCASDLLEIGWDLGSWYRRPKVAGHPFCDYLHAYDHNLSVFESHYKSPG